MAILHILSSPHSPVNPFNRVDAFSIIVYKFIRYMSQRGWKCVHYGLSESSVDCEMVACLDVISQDAKDNITKYNKNAAVEIAKRKQTGDLLLCFYGDENKIAADYNQDLLTIEPSIGYSPHAVFAPYRVFTSYAQMHYYYGVKNQLLNPNWNDAVIYNPITKEEFEYCDDKQDYVLYFGRIVECKGLNLAVQATQIAGKKLIIAGPGDLRDLGYSAIPHHVMQIGICNSEQRRQLMSKASAIIAPTLYLEPFGNMIAEGFMSGTPAITTDWGAFSETVVHGVTGYRCREFKDFVSAIKNIKSINPKDCREWALKNCEDQIVYDKYDSYLKKILDNNFYR